MVRLMTMRLVAVAVLPVLLTGCAAAQDDESATGPALAAAAAAAAGTLAGLNLDVGASETHQVLTHCGVESVKINGAWWNAVAPRYGPAGEGAGPPDDWTQPWQEGTLTLKAEDRAVFAAVGEQVVFAPAPGDKPLRYCR
jgi:hypothetical protein